MVLLWAISDNPGVRASLRSDVVNLFGELQDVYNELYGNEKDWKKVSGSGGFMQRLVNEYGLASLAEMEVFFKGMTNGEYINPYGENATGVKVNSPYGYRRSNKGKDEFHAGWDFTNGDGSQIYSIADGIVVKSDYDSSMGNYVIVKHFDPMMGAFGVVYMHLASEGTGEGIIYQGSEIGNQGNTGASVGSHLHFQTWYGTDYSFNTRNSKSFNPLTELYGIKMTRDGIDNSGIFIMRDNSYYDWEKSYLNRLTAASKSNYNYGQLTTLEDEFKLLGTDAPWWKK